MQTPTQTCMLLANQTHCLDTEGCLWCENKQKCSTESLGCPGDNGLAKKPYLCASVSNETECVQEARGCFWCQDKSVCRASMYQCPGNENLVRLPDVCLQLNNETECSEASCFWCEDKYMCRQSEEECPGRGRGNPCKRFEAEEGCADQRGCRWNTNAKKCLAARGMDIQENNTTIVPTAKVICPLLLDEGNCTSQIACRWCDIQEKCQKASLGACPDGGMGKRGNPCPLQNSSSACAEVEGCLWCMGREKCRKANKDACAIDEDTTGDDGGNHTEVINQCHRNDAEPECSSTTGCQWCELQGKCRKEESSCGEATRYVEIDLDELQRGSFKIQDDGLGKTDPNSVSIGLSHLFEINAEGEMIGTSLVDFSLQRFQVEQSVGLFFGGLEARRISFESSVHGVGIVSLDTYMFLEEGTIETPGNETWSVKVGDVKFNAILKDWVFCDEDEGASCAESNETSAYVDVAFDIKGKSEQPEMDIENRLFFNLGGNVPLILSGEVQVDGDVRAMPEGFPRAKMTLDQGTTFVFRFPRFAKSITYDPLIPYHTATIVDVSDNNVVEDDASNTLAPTKAPTQSPSARRAMTTAPTETITAPPSTGEKQKENPATPNSLASKDDKNILSKFVIIGIALGVLMCCVCCAYIAARMRGSHDNVTGLDDKGNRTINDDDNLDRLGDDPLLDVDPEAGHPERFKEELSDRKEEDAYGEKEEELERYGADDYSGEGSYDEDDENYESDLTGSSASDEELRIN